MNIYTGTLKKAGNFELTRDPNFLEGRMDAFDVLAMSMEKQVVEREILTAKKP
jgi:hypothetical protein